MRTNLRAAAVLLIIIVAGCTSPPETRYYSLRAESAAKAPAPANAPVVLVDRFVVDEPYADARIAYRRAPHELGYDPYSCWAGSPAAQVEDAVRDLLAGAGLFSAVRQVEPAGLGRGSYDLVVTGRVSRLEEVDEEDRWLAALDVELLLLDGRTREVLASSRTDATSPAEKRNPRLVAERLSSLLEDAVKKFADKVRPIVRRK
jgi:uncharacterized lipoprotein YmbA